MQSLSLFKIHETFSTEAKAEAWFHQTRWSEKPICPCCRGKQITALKNRKTMPYRCRDCGKLFSIRTGTQMENQDFP